MNIINKQRKSLYLVIFSLFFVIGCSKEDEVQDSFQEASLKVENQSNRSSRGKVVHHVIVGSKDNCEELGLPQGCRGNLSLVANVYEDGSVDGQWQDTFSDNGEGLHVDIDCVKIGFSRFFAYAIIGGYIKKGKIDGVDVSGQYALTSAIDLDYLRAGEKTGRPIQEDFISLSYNGEYQDCNTVDTNLFSIYPFSKGQVKIW